MALGGKPGERGRLIYDNDGRLLMVTRPIDGHPTTAANGGNVGTAAISADHVRAWYEAGTAHGGISIETPPCERPNGAFVAYLRDLDGTKLTAQTMTAR